MDTREAFDESMLISSLSVQWSDYDTAHHFEVKKRKVHYSFGLILDGSVSFFTLTDRVDAQAGDVIFVPEGIRYSSCWSGDPKIRFVNLHFRMLSPASSIFRSIRIRKLPQVEADLRDRILRIAQHGVSAGASGFSAFSEFYALCAELYPLIREDCGNTLPAPLLRAMAYIGDHYRSVSKVSEISKACYISESHLYHLFGTHLGTSPIAYLNSLRIQKAMELLVSTDQTVEHIASELGFHSGYYFRKTFQSVTGILPSKYRKYT